MLGVACVQIACSIGAVWFGARTAMSFGRDVRGAIFHRVGTFSQREVQHFGAPSLITRQTNDVQQVQMLVLLSCTLMVMAPIMMVGGIFMAIRQDLGLSWIIVVTVPVLAAALGFIISRMVPSFRSMQSRIDEVNRLLREQITGVRVVRGVRARAAGDRALRRRQPRPHRGRHPGRPLAGHDVPDRDADRQRRLRRGALVRRSPRRVRRDAGRRADGVPRLPHADRDVGDDGDLHDDADPAVGGLRRPDRRGARHRHLGAGAGPDDAVDRACPSAAPSSCRASSTAIPAPTSRCCTTSRSGSSPARPSPSSGPPAPARAPWSTWCPGSST